MREKSVNSIGTLLLPVLSAPCRYDTNMKLTMVLTNEWVACLFTLSIMIIGIYIVLNLFLAILLANLDKVVDDPLFQDRQPDSYMNRSMPSTNYPSNAVVPWPQSRRNSVMTPMTEEMRTASVQNAVVVDFWHLASSSKNKMASNIYFEGDSSKQMWEDDHLEALDELSLRPSPSSSPANHDPKPPPPWSKNIKAIPEADEIQSVYQDRSLEQRPVSEGIEEEAILPRGLPHSDQETLRIPGSNSGLDSTPNGATGLDKLLFSDSAQRKNSALLASKSSGPLLGSKRLGFNSNFAGSKQHNSNSSNIWSGSGFLSTVLSSFTLDDDNHETYLLKTAYLQQVLRGRSLFLFSGINPLRRFLAKVVVSSWFDTISIAMIILSSLELCFDDAGVEAGSSKAHAIYVMDIFFTIVFGIEVSRALICTFLIPMPDILLCRPC